MGKSIHQLVQPEQIKAWLAQAFSEVGISTLETLRDDKIVLKAALIAYQGIPLFPVRVAIKATIGQDGFTAFVFRVRDKMVEANSTDLSWLTVSSLKSLLDSSETNSVVPLASLGMGDNSYAAPHPPPGAPAPAPQAPPTPPAPRPPPPPQTNSSHCPLCRYENRALAKFCRACGAVLNEEAVDSQSTVTPVSEGSGPSSRSVAMAELSAPEIAIGTLANGAPLQDTVARPDSDHQRSEDAAPSPAPQATATPVLIPNSAPISVQGAHLLDFGDSVVSPKVQERGAVRLDDRNGAHTSSPAKSQVETVASVVSRPVQAAHVPVEPSPLLGPARETVGPLLIAAIVAGVMLIVGAAYFAGGFFNNSTQKDPSSRPQGEIPPTVVSLSPTTGMPARSPLPEAPASNDRLVEIDSQTTQNTSTVPTKSGKAIYAGSCQSCHATGLNGSPRPDDLKAWRPRLARSRASLYASVLNGKGAMRSCTSDQLLRVDEIKRAIDFMVAEAKSTAKTGAPVTSATGTASPQLGPAVSALPAAVAPTDGQPNWLPAMRTDLGRCSQGNFIEKVVCTEKVRWKYCAPDRWNTIPECTVAKPDNAPGNS